MDIILSEIIFWLKNKNHEDLDEIPPLFIYCVKNLVENNGYSDKDYITKKIIDEVICHDLIHIFVKYLWPSLEKNKLRPSMLKDPWFWKNSPQICTFLLQKYPKKYYIKNGIFLPLYQALIIDDEYLIKHIFIMTKTYNIDINLDYKNLSKNTNNRNIKDFIKMISYPNNFENFDAFALGHTYLTKECFYGNNKQNIVALLAYDYNPYREFHVNLFGIYKKYNCFDIAKINRFTDIFDILMKYNKYDPPMKLESYHLPSIPVNNL